MGHGGMGCGMKTMRFIMVLFNIFFFLIGLALVALGIYLFADPSLQKIKQIIPLDASVSQGLSYLEVMAIVILVVGGFLLLTGFLGCCGAMKQVKIFLIIYAIIIGIIILFEIAITIYFVAFQSKFRNQITPQLQKSIADTYEGPFGLVSGSTLPKPQPVSVAWDFIMYNFKCCGADGKSDFNGSLPKWNRTNPWWNSTMDSSTRFFAYPITCCNISGFGTDWNNLPLDKLQAYASCAINGTNINGQGCVAKVLEVINNAKTWIIVGAVIVLVIELAAFIFALALCCRKRKDTMYYSS